MNIIRYLLDENVAHAVRNRLLFYEPDMIVLCIGDETAPVLGTPDPLILDWIESNGYMLVSRNRRTIPVHLQEHIIQGKEIPGIFLIRSKATIAQIIDDLLMIWQASEADEYRNQIRYLPF